MRTATRAAAALTAATMVLCAVAMQAQNVHYGESFELNSTLVPNESHEYYAGSYIDLKSGFHSAPNRGNHTFLELNNEGYTIHPPEAGLTNSDKYVVGALGGTVDVGSMGAAIYSIPLELPTGINGMQPNLAITYNSQAGNGLLGWGWDLTGLSLIERTGRTRYHDGVTGSVTMNDTTDRFMLDGVRLITVADYTDSIEYKTEQDGMWRVMAYHDWLGGPSKENTGAIYTVSHFKVWRDDGILLEYGCTDDSRLTLQTTGPRVLCWMLNRMSDRNGNSVEYHYAKTPSTGECYISSVDYTEHAENGNTVVRPEFTVDFHYRSQNRKDYDFRYVAGNILKSRKLLDYISVSSNESSEELERYSFTYGLEKVEMYYDSVNMHNRLDKIFLEKEGVMLNPTSISWSSYGDDYVINNIKILDSAIYNNFPFVGDFNGDGYSDLAVAPHMDSVYTHNVDVNFFMNNPSNPGHFSQNTTLTLHNMDKKLDWLYPVDLNDDGLDDLVACFYDSVAATGSESMSVVVLENMGGTYFESMDTVHLNTGRYLVRTGDFLGNGKTQLLLVPVTILSLAFPKLVYHDGNDYQKALSILPLLDVQDVATGDFDGDGRTEFMVVMENSSAVCSLGLNGSNYIEYSVLFNLSEINHAESYNHVFTGDFNGDGKTDLLYNDKYHHPNNYNHLYNRWRVFYSTGVSFSASGNLNITCELPPYNLYSYSLRRVMDAMAQPESSNYLNYSLCAADFDGDGITDIAISNRSSINIYFKFNPETREFLSCFLGGSFNGQHNNNPDYYYINCRSQYFHLGNFLVRENKSFLGLEKKEGIVPVRREPGVFSLKPASALNSVSIVNDGMDNPVGFAYGYVHNTYQELGYGVRRLPVPIRVATSITTYNASDKQMNEVLGYSDPCHHRDGHGWLGFRKQVRKTLEDGTEVQRTVSRSSLATMTTHAMLLPEVDTSYVFPHGQAVLSSVTTYQFDKVLSTCGLLYSNRLVTCPALTGKTIVTYDPDNPGTVLTKSFTENRYSYSNGLYNHTYRCNNTLTGVGGPSVSGLTGCEFQATDSTAYYGNDYDTWTINRPRKSIRVTSRTGKPDVEHSLKYQYAADDSYQLSQVTDIPGDIDSQDPLTVRTSYTYYPDGNLMGKTVTAPYGLQGEQQKTYGYEYDRHRLVSKETVSSGGLSYQTTYTYDGYDRVDTLTGANGLATAYRSDPFGITSWTMNADSTKACTALRWAQGHPLAPSGACYYSWTQSSGGSEALVFYHKTGAELRTVTYGLHGEHIFTDREYDDRGRLSGISDSYVEGGTPRWTLYGYDGMDRPTSVTTPDNTCTSTVYDGYETETTVTPTVGRPQTSTVTVNAMGWTVRSDDASGSYVTYDHYADGLLATARVNGNTAATMTATYDHARRKNTVTDPDYGTLTTVYDAYGRLRTSVSERESEMHTQTTCVYDGMDRKVSVTDGMEGTLTQYTYNESGVEKGTLDEVLFQEIGGADIQSISYIYDVFARPIRIIEMRSSGSGTTTIQYDGQSRVKQLTHPSGVTVNYGYHRGYLSNVFDAAGNLLWKTEAMDARGQLLEAQLGNGAVTEYTYDPLMHRLTGIATTKNLQQLTYSYDKFGNLASRKDWKKNMEETFTYDDMNRLTGITLKRSSGQDLTCTVTYDALGRMTSRQAVIAVNLVPQVTQVFSQPVFDATKVHALASATTTSGIFPPTPQTVTYTGFDKVSKVKQGTDSICYTYGFNQQRIYMEEHAGATDCTKQYWGSCEYVTESDGIAISTYWRTFVTGPYGVFAVVESRNGMDQFHYVLKDNLGSWTTITNATGTVEQQLSYDAWGNLRNPITWANYRAGDTYDGPMFDRGYTGHEHVEAFGLINMNGRMYDPVMGGFLSVDRFVQNPLTAQGFNRYAYCMNNPLRFVDPTGWEPGPGSGNGDGPYLPGAPYYVDGMLTVDLPEIIIMPDNPSLSNRKEAVTYNTYYYGGERLNLSWTSNSEGQSVGPNSGGCGGGGGTHGGDYAFSNQGLTVDLSLLLSCEGVHLGYKQQLWQNPRSRTQKLINQKKAYDIQKDLKSKGVSKHVKDIKAGRISKLRVANRGIVALGVGLEVYDVIDSKEIRTSNIVSVGVTIASIWCWPVGGVYLATDIGSLLFTGRPIGDHIDDWVGEPLYDFNKP